MTRIVAACALASFRSGCAITGMREVVDSKGPVDKDTTGLVGAFDTTEKQSFDNSSVSLHAAAMFNSGYALVQGGCETFFKSAGQQWAASWRTRPFARMRRSGAWPSRR